jgi:hypothetical protein
LTEALVRALGPQRGAEELTRYLDWPTTPASMNCTATAAVSLPLPVMPSPIDWITLGDRFI